MYHVFKKGGVGFARAIGIRNHDRFVCEKRRDRRAHGNAVVTKGVDPAAVQGLAAADEKAVLQLLDIRTESLKKRRR